MRAKLLSWNVAGLASAGLRPLLCDYLHEWREAGLSDHSAMETLFEPAGPPQ